MKQLDHPNIVKYYTGWYDKEKIKVIIITEMVSGGSLKQNLKSIRSPRLRLLKKWIKEILSGLGKMYASGGEFTENIDSYGGEGTAEFTAKAIDIYCQ